ncbi:AI-2E family transporter [Patescibacteria group bacterium]|nr:AI-2E family transporter [Patescibacteria group bacterium]
MNQQSTFNISWSTIFKIVIAVICLYILYLVKDLIVWFIFALVIGILFNYLIDFLEKKRIPRLAATILLYFGVFVALGFFTYKTAPIFLSEIEEFTQNLPQYLQKISPIFEKFGVQAFKSTEALTQTLQINLEKAGENIFSALFSIFGGAFSTLFIIFLAFFISLEKNLVERVLTAFSPSKYKEYLHGLWERSKQKVSGWFISRVIGALFVGSLTYLILRILNVEYALILSLMAGILDFIPIIGPLVAGLIIAFIVALTSLFQAGFVLVAFFIIQLLENNLLFPLLFKKFTGLPPVLVLVAFAIGAKLWGVLGAILAIPLAGVIFELLKDYLAKRKREIPEELP